jgi:nitroimidazol reductase NimA-like FMN-containing flavoprotein (pyridoxamine 5'-phosphate oxidase superfamily)
METKSNAREMTPESIDAFLRSHKAGVLSLTDGLTAYGIPLAYFFDEWHIYLTLGRSGRKMDYVKPGGPVSFAVFSISDGFGIPGKTGWTSVICEGNLEHLRDAAEITRAVRAGERHMGMPEGTWENLLQMTLRTPEHSNFWWIYPTRIGGRTVADEEIVFEE